MAYGELYLPSERPNRNALNGQFLKGHTPHNKGKSWSDYCGKRAQKRMAKGWKNVELHRPKKRPDTSKRCRRAVIAIDDEGNWYYFTHSDQASEKIGGHPRNIRRCCECNASRIPHKRTGTVNTDHRYIGFRWYYEKDDIWTTKI